MQGYKNVERVKPSGLELVDRLVGVMNLTTPVVITPSTIGFKFTFNVTGYGAQLFSITTPSNTADGGGGSGAFSGFFTVTEASQQ